MPRDSSSRFMIGEIIGTVVIAVASVVMIAGVAVYASGNEIAIFALILAFAVGTTGVGVLAAGRDARRQRDAKGLGGPPTR